MRFYSVISFILWMISVLTPVAVLAQSTGPLRIEITEGVIEPLPFALPVFEAETTGSDAYAVQISDVVVADLTGTGLFRQIDPSAFISKVDGFAAPIQYTDWKAINAQALITGAVSVQGNQLSVKFRLYDVFSDAEMGSGLQFSGTTEGWRRMAHKVSDAVYSRITGEGGYFDSRVVYVSEAGTKDARQKRLAIMDYDGANVQYLTDSSSIVLAPRFSPDGSRVLYTSYETGFPRIFVLDVGSVQRRVLESREGTMSFAPRFAPDGQTIVYSLSQGGNTDIYQMNLNGGGVTRLTTAPSIETA
ncbi:MAG: Tol-Pal system protein TolB, partial [Pseudomonadota bacterium]